jgi:hypothetical protein
MSPLDHENNVRDARHIIRTIHSKYLENKQTIRIAINSFIKMPLEYFNKQLRLPVY